MDILYSIFGYPLPLNISISFGLTGLISAGAGSFLSSKLTIKARRAGSFFTLLGLGFMALSVLCFMARLSSQGHA